MKENEVSKSLMINPSYPHTLLSYLRRMPDIDNISLLLDSESFFRHYEENFSYDDLRLESVREACRLDVIAEMAGILNEPMWRKRSFVNKAAMLLMHDGNIKEFQMAELLESFMQLFDWDFELEVMRRWDTSLEDTSLYHKENGEPRRLSTNRVDIVHDSENTSEVNKTNKTDESNETNETDETNEASEINKTDETNETSGIKGAKKNNAQKLNDDLTSDKTDIAHVQITKDNVLDEARYNNPLKIEDILNSSDSGEEPVDIINMNDYIQNEIIKHGILFENIMTLAVRRDVKSAIKGNSDAQFRMGTYYAEADSGHTDYEEAMKWYRVSASQGNKKARFELGMLYDSGKVKCDNYKMKALKCYFALADSGYPTAQCMIAMKYRFGDGVDEDINESIKWFKRAACQGHIDAQRNLGDVYVAIRKTAEAVKWYERAAAAGDIYSEKQLERLK